MYVRGVPHTSYDTRVTYQLRTRTRTTIIRRTAVLTSSSHRNRTAVKTQENERKQTRAAPKNILAILTIKLSAACVKTWKHAEMQLFNTTEVRTRWTKNNTPHLLVIIIIMVHIHTILVTKTYTPYQAYNTPPETLVTQQLCFFSIPFNIFFPIPPIY